MGTFVTGPDPLPALKIDRPGYPPTGLAYEFDASDYNSIWSALADVRNALGSAGITALTGDVTASGSGSRPATVVSVGGSTAANIHAAELLANAATSANTASTIVRRDGSGGIAVGGVTFPDATVQTTAASSLALAAVGSTPNANAGSVVSGVLNLQPASASFPGVVTTGAQTFAGAKTFSSSIIANLTGNATGSAGSFTGSLVGDVTGTQGATVVATVGGQSAAAVAAAATAVAAATASGAPSTLVLRDGTNSAALNVTGSITQVGGCTAQALTSPVNATFTLGTGTLATGTYYYRVTALWNDGETLPSTETSLAITGPAGVNVNWAAVTGATGYRIYGRTTGAELLIATVGIVTTYLDNGSVTPAGAMPNFNTTGGLSMPGNQTYTGIEGVLFNTPNTSNAVSGPTAVASCFVYRGPVGWSGASAAGKIVDYQDGSGSSLFSVNRFGVATASGVFSAPIYGYAGGNPSTFQGQSNELGFTLNSPFGAANVILNAQNGSGNPDIDPSTCIVQVRDQGWVRSVVNLDGFWVGGVSATGLSVPALCKPIIAQNCTLAAGTLAAGTYYYRITALNANGETLPCAEKSFVLGSTGGVRVYWLPVLGATSYSIYGRTTGAETLLTNISANTTSLWVNASGLNSGFACSWVDDGSLTPSGAMPSANTTAGVTGGFAIKALPAPVARTFTTGAGTLTAATYYYRVSAVNDFGETLAFAEKSYTLGSTGGVNVNWQPVPGAAQFKIYGRTTGAELLIGTVDANIFTFLDNGSVTPSGALPTANTTGNYSTAGKRIDANASNSSGSPGAATLNSATGKSAIAAAASSVVITNNLCTTNSIVQAWVQQSTADATLTQVIRTSAAAGSFTIYGNANATAATVVAWEIIN